MSAHKIAICTSASFYKQAVEVADQLASLGLEGVLPYTARVMKEKNDFEVSHYKTWHADESTYYKKAEYMRGHFKEVEAADAILVLNYDKHEQKNYIGGNVLMEMALAFHLDKPIYILNDLPENSSFLEELKGLQPIILRGDLTKINL